MKLFLVSSPVLDSPEALGLGAASVAAAIAAAGIGIEVALVEARPGEGASELASRIASSSAQAVGFSVYSWSRALLAEVALRLRELRPSAILFAGGPEVTADPGSFLKDAGLDFAIAGEGESAAVRALGAIAQAGAEARAEARLPFDTLRGIAGIALPGESWRQAPPEEVGALASPWLLGTMKVEDCGGDVIWELSRGCPFRCAYCYESKGSSGSRPFPMERIEAELALFARAGVRYAFVLDPTFDSDPRRAGTLLDLFRAKGSGIRWKFEVRAELLDKVLARKFAALDCSLQIGLQSVRAETLALVGRPGFDRREFARKAAMLSQAGQSFGLDLIYGLPGDRLSDFEEGVDFAIGLEPNHLDLFPLALLPGTELADRASELGIEADPRPPYLVRRTRELPPEDFARAAALAKAADRFYSTGRAVAWFEAVRKPLRLSPSALLRGYADYLARRPGERLGRSADSRDIEAEQLGYLAEAYARRGLGALVPALCDLVRLHGAWGRALAEGEESVLDLDYDPEEALGAAATGLAAFVRGASPAKGRWRIAPDEAEGARIESVSGKERGPR